MARVLIAGLIAMVIAVAVGPYFIAWLKRQSIGQQIREEGPAGHVVKAGTPTMGGLLILVAALTPATNLFVVARGFGLGIAQEAALKLKETCGLHAEAFSSAEVKHGPMALVRAGFPVLMFSQDDETRAGIEQLATEFAARKARVLVAGAKAQGA